MKFSTATVALLLLACGISLPARAGEHPVPLEKNVDAAKCLECHEDKSKGKNVHSAIAMGCTSCHEVKVEGETTNINLNQPANELCFTCHAKDVKEEDSKHGPWDKGECVLCHDPHQSDFPKQLRAEGNVLCMECHRTRVDIKGDTVKIFESHEMKLDEYREAKKLKLNGEWESGHPLANHPVANVPDYTRGQGAKMQCITCHMPHSSSDDKLGRMVTV
jgi:predicted CXXCH cytochrome family protein